MTIPEVILYCVLAICAVPVAIIAVPLLLAVILLVGGLGFYIVLFLIFFPVAVVQQLAEKRRKHGDKSKLQ